MGQRPLDVRGQGFRVEVTLVTLLGHRGGTHRIEFPRERGIDVARSRRGGFADALQECGEGIADTSRTATVRERPGWISRRTRTVIGEGRSLTVAVRLSGGLRGDAMRWVPREDFKQDGAQAVDVGALVEQVHSAGDLFGGLKWTPRVGQQETLVKRELAEVVSPLASDDHLLFGGSR